MEDWKKYKARDFCQSVTDGTHDSPKPKDKGYYLITSKHLKESGIDFSSANFISEEDYLKVIARSEVEQYDILYSMIGTIGNIVQVKNEKVNFAVKNMGIFKMGKDFLRSTWLFYWLKSPYAYKYVQQRLAGSTQSYLTLNSLREFPILYPGNDEAKRIIAVLKSLDDKIEVNRRINDNLEQQAQALFKSWFVNFEPFKDQSFVESELGMIPKGWKVVSLDDMTSKFGTGLNPRQNFKLGEGDNYYVTIKNMGNNRVFLDDKCDKVTDEAIEKINKRSKLQKGDLLFSGIGTIGRVAMLTETPSNWNTSESVFNLHPEKDYSTEFLYVLLLSDLFQQYVKIHAQGGVQQGIRMASLKQYQMAIPSKSLMKEFDSKILPLISLIRNTDKEIDNLCTIRDTILPRLMSGELKVNEIEKSL